MKYVVMLYFSLFTFSAYSQKENLKLLKNIADAVNEVLVFYHVKYPEVSPQLPSGTVEINAPHAQAAQREFLEETDITAKKILSILAITCTTNNIMINFKSVTCTF